MTSSEPGGPLSSRAGWRSFYRGGSAHRCTGRFYWFPTPCGLDPAAKRRAPRGRLRASSPVQSVTPSQARDSAPFKHFGKVTPCSVVTDEKGQKRECFCWL